MTKKNILDGLEGNSHSFIATEEDLRSIGASIPPKPAIEQKDEKPIVNKDGTALTKIDYTKERVVIDAPKGSNDNETRDNDFQYMRENLYGIIETSQEALLQLAQIAGQSQHPRAFEVLALLVKTISDANKDLMKIHADKTKVEKDTGKTDKTGTVTNNNLIVGTTAQLDEIMRKLKLKNE